MSEQEEFRKELEARVTHRTHHEDDDVAADVSAIQFREEAFTEVVLDTLLDLGQIPDVETLYFQRTLGRYAVKVNGWACNSELGEVDLVTTLYAEEGSADSFPPSELKTAVSRAARTVAEAHRGVHKEMEPASPAWDMMQSLHDSSSAVERVRVIVVTNVSVKDIGILEHDFDFELTSDVWDLKRLHRVEASGLPYEPVSIDIQGRLGEPISCIPAPDISPDYDAYLALIPGEFLCDLYHEFGPRLLELNVRSFLQARGKVNRGLRDTLNNAPDRFLAYNNGISITAEDVVLSSSRNEIPGITSGITSVTGLQVVNGGQTVASIHRAKHRDGQDISKVQVQAKITVVKGGQEVVDELVPLVSRYSNTQNRVNEADFSANHPFHVKIQQLSEKIWAPGEQVRWFYERARGQYEVALSREGTTPARARKFKETRPRSQKFDKVLLAKCMNAWAQLPHIVSRGGQKNFVAFMNELARTHAAGWEPDVEYYQRLVARLILYKEAERSARKHKFPGYRANAIAYTLAAISYRTAGRIDLDSIWSAQDCSPALSKTIHEWMPVIHEQLVETAGSRNVTEWCKKEECWSYIRGHGMEVSTDLDAELAEGAALPSVGKKAHRKGMGLSPEQREDIARTMQKSAEDWIRISMWGNKTGKLEDWQAGIAGTLAAYAAANWKKVPSARQARLAVEMIAIADKEGAWLDEED
ncbi:AIPR family protein [Gemmatimonadales bacterium]|nr:AIPR family protein [Gemmatimonadales bacterium]